jgi:hypothetical protein
MKPSSIPSPMCTRPRDGIQPCAMAPSTPIMGRQARVRPRGTSTKSLQRPSGSPTAVFTGCQRQRSPETKDVSPGEKVFRHRRTRSATRLASCPTCPTIEGSQRGPCAVFEPIDCGEPMCRSVRVPVKPAASFGTRNMCADASRRSAVRCYWSQALERRARRSGASPFGTTR